MECEMARQEQSEDDQRSAGTDETGSVAGSGWARRLSDMECNQPMLTAGLNGQEELIEFYKQLDAKGQMKVGFIAVNAYMAGINNTLDRMRNDKRK
jgi:hypothetical protein